MTEDQARAACHEAENLHTVIVRHGFVPDYGAQLVIAVQLTHLTDLLRELMTLARDQGPADVHPPGPGTL